MILYFADRQLNIVGQASTLLPEGLTIRDDWKTEDVETGISVFECRIPYDTETRASVENCANVGNYILRKHENANEFYTIIDAENDTKNQEVWVYAENAGLDLLNSVVGAYEADKAYPITHYIELFANDSGFVIGTNEAASLKRKLTWDGEATAAERLASVATQFDGCELSFSFDIDNLEITNKYINIHKKRGKTLGEQLRLNIDIDRIVSKSSIANIATALDVTGGTPEDENTDDDKEPQPITLKNLKYDDGNFYVDGTLLKSREALKKWSRYSWTKEPNTTQAGGHIVRLFSYDTLSPNELLSHAITELEKRCEAEVNYEVDFVRLPENVRLGDRINIVDDAGELYVETRILKLEESVANDTKKATLGEFLIKSGGISQKVADLAEKFAQNSKSAARALAVANAAKTKATDAAGQASAAAVAASNAQAAADGATAAANAATESAAKAQTAASNAQAAVDSVGKSVEAIETTVNNAQAVANAAQAAATTAVTKADEAATAATQAKTEAAEASAAVTIAQTNAATAVTKADEAKATAAAATTTANNAKSTADAAKSDAEAANADIASLGERLTTVSNTMVADYARKTDLTEATASLQTQITQNAAEISTTATKVQTIDETANDALEQAQTAQAAAQAAKAQADTATADAEAAQTAADAAQTAANNAQAEADAAKAAAATAQGAADKAGTDLAKAQADLATVSSRVDATEEDIATAQAAVNAAQAAANKANEDAAAAAKKAADAQTTADTAVSDAANAQAKANEAASAATIAQATADAAKGNAAAAQKTADEAAQAAENAQSTANTAKTNAAAAQSKANEAAQAAASAQTAANNADAKAAAAQSELNTAKQNLADVASRVGATEAEVQAAQQAVEEAQQAADNAQAEAEAAQNAANAAKTDAAKAQTAADNAKTAADNAQAAADAAQDTADEAQAAADALAVRVTTAETNITQNSEQIALRATKTEVATTLGGYYTKEEANAAIEVSANAVKTTVSNTYATQSALAATDEKATNAAQAAGNAAAAVNKAVKEHHRYYIAQSEPPEKPAEFPPASGGDTLTWDGNVNGALAIEEAFVFVTSAAPAFDDVGANVGHGSTGYVEMAGERVGLHLWATAIDEAIPTDEAYMIGGVSDAAQTTFAVVVLQDGFTLDGATTFPVGTYMMCFAEGATHSMTIPNYTGFDGGWSETEPEYSAGKSVFTVACDLFIDGSFAYGEVSKMGAYDIVAEGIAQTQAAQAAIEENIAVALTEQHTAIVQDSEAIILQALEEYQTTQDAEAFEEKMVAQLAVMSDAITMNFTASAEMIDGVNGEMQGKFTELYDYIKFSGGGISINESSGLTLELAGGLIAFKKNGNTFGTWDGENFRTGNIFIDVNERAQLGNFAYIPRSDGSLMFLKVGG